MSNWFKLPDSGGTPTRFDEGRSGLDGSASFERDANRCAEYESALSGRVSSGEHNKELFWVSTSLNKPRHGYTIKSTASDATYDRTPTKNCHENLGLENLEGMAGMGEKKWGARPQKKNKSTKQKWGARPRTNDSG